MTTSSRKRLMKKSLTGRVKVYGDVLTASLTLQERRDQIISKLQHQPSITLWEILTLISGYVPEGKFVQVVEWGCAGENGGSWKLDVSKLGVNTSLGWGSQAGLITPGAECESLVRDGWQLGVSRLGLDTILDGTKNWEAVAQAQNKAYTYEVRIFDYELPPEQLTQLVQELRRSEPARSGRIIKQNQNLADYGAYFSRDKCGTIF
jgi:hypothetical protein